MIIPGLVSITFRQFAPPRVIELAGEAGLQGIEWGGDIHVPHGNLDAAAEVRRRTVDAGLSVVSYGSYYRVGCDESAGLNFETVLETALALGAPLIRVWAGNLDPEQADEAFRDHLVEETVRIASLSAKAGVGISFEAHGGTVANGTRASAAFLDCVTMANVSSYWQPPNGAQMDVCEDGLACVLPRLSHLHVFHWWPTTGTRLPLEEGRSRWLTYLKMVHQAGGDHFALLEFVRQDSPEALFEDARTLKQWLGLLGG